jgi:nicotinamide-nucleotide adenylyltransferase
MSVLYGMVHGRFQPFHNGHLEYVLSALQRCDHLIVGITNPDPSLIVRESADPDRHLPEANLFTFFERQWMVRVALAEARCEANRVSLVPFPIHHPERWQFYCPPETTQFVRLFSAWGREKFERFQTLGWPVVVLDAGVKKQVSGTEIRRRLSAGQGWEELVPFAVAQILREIGAMERMRKVVSSQ